MKSIVPVAAALLLSACAANPPVESASSATAAAPALGGPPQKVAETRSGKIRNFRRQLAVFMSLLPGTFESADQEKGPGAGTRMRIAEFWKDPQEDGEYWFYVEHAKAGQDDKPFRQRIYRFVTDGTRYWGEQYALPGKPQEFIGEWRKPKPFASIKPAQLREYPDCRFKVGQMTMLFWVETEGQKCQGGDPAIAWEMTSMLVHSAGMKEGTQGFDAAGKRVAGESAVWEFRRVSREPG